MDSIPSQGRGFCSSSFTRSWRYDVFLSFRGEDTRNNFTGHLHSNLVHRGINTFIDEDELPRGGEISPALVKAIEESRISVIVFSENYASSKWCLDELAEILECKESKQVRPIFYKVDPSDVRNQRGSFGEALANHESKFKDDMEKVLRWRRALTKAANLSGWPFSEGHESKFIHSIVEEISVQLVNRALLNVAKYPVGIESRVRAVECRLSVGGNDVRMVGIWGIGGIGKTTVAKGVYNSIADEFEGSCLLENVRERSMQQQGLVELQRTLLSEILGGKKLEVNNVGKGITVIKERLVHKKVLLILDDVNQLDQLNKLAGGFDWFGSGSRIIITTRDKQLLTAHDVHLIYEVKELDGDEAFQLFSCNAFKRNQHLDDDYVKLAKTIVHYAQGLPLALTVLGSHLCGRSLDQWEDALDSYKKIPNQEILEVLKVSYDALEEAAREIFLDIAFFFQGSYKSNLINILEGCDRNPRYGIDVLIEKALINIDGMDRIWMHQLLEDMGKEIVRKESPNKPGKRSRLWCHKDISHVLTQNKGTYKIIGIKLQFPEGFEADEICLNAKSFSKMTNLQIFMNRNARLSGEVDYLPNELRVIEWPEFPLQSFPSNFNSKKLVVLKIPRNRMLQLDGIFKGLREINLEDSEFLTITPDFSGSRNLKYLNLNNCTRLVELHPSIGFLHKLVELSLGRCCSVTMFPRIVNLESLLMLNLSGCVSLGNFPEILGKMDFLSYLDLSETAIKELPSSSIRYFTNLKKLYLAGCENLTNLPYSIYELKHLKEISVYKCPRLVTFPKLMKSEVSLSSGSAVTHGGGTLPEKASDDEANLAFPELSFFGVGGCPLSGITDFLATLDCVFTLQTLYICGSNFVNLPICISNLVNLRTLRMWGCKRLEEIPQLPPKVERVDAGDCISLERFSKLSNILDRKESQLFRKVDLTNCCRLWNNLVGKAKKIYMLQNKVDLFSCFLSSQRNEFHIEFPGAEIPKWFSFRKDLKDLRECEISIKIPQDFDWEGLSFCFTLEKTDNRVKLVPEINFNDMTIDFYASEIKHFDIEKSTYVSLAYYPIKLWISEEIKAAVLMKRPSLFSIRLHLKRISRYMKSCGVHVVTPPGRSGVRSAFSIQYSDQPW